MVRGPRLLVLLPYQGVNKTAVSLALLALLLTSSPATMAEENVRLQCTPHTFQVVPGEPIRLELTVRADSAVPLRVHVPDEPLLMLRAFEKLPVRRTAEGVVFYRRVVVWQGLEPGTIKIKTLSVEANGQKRLFPEVTISVSDPGP